MRLAALLRKVCLAEGKNPRSYIHAMGDFLLKWVDTLGDNSFINVASRYLNKEKNKTAKLQIVALDPSKITEPVFASTYSNVIMSGTLQPLEAYARITKLPQNTVKCIVPSPFPKEHVFSAVCLGVTTAMEKRTPAMYQMMIQRISEVSENTPTNTGIFAASFDVLNALLSEGLENSLQKPLFHERRGMTSKSNEKMVSDFKALRWSRRRRFPWRSRGKNLGRRGFSRQPNEFCNSSGRTLCGADTKSESPD